MQGTLRLSQQLTALLQEMKQKDPPNCKSSLELIVFSLSVEEFEMFLPALAEDVLVGPEVEVHCRKELPRRVAKPHPGNQIHIASHFML